MMGIILHCAALGFIEPCWSNSGQLDDSGFGGSLLRVAWALGIISVLRCTEARPGASVSARERGMLPTFAGLSGRNIIRLKYVVC